MICFINRSTVDYDIRMNKYVQACKATNTPYFVLGWDRMLNAKFVDEHEKQLKIYSPYGQGRNFWHLLRWMFFVWFNLISNIGKYKVIHACNMENAMFVLPFKLFGKKIVFDIYDSQIAKVEKIIIPKVDTLILPHQKRLEQIGISKDKVENLFIVENAPTLNYELRPLKPRKDDKIHLSYVGTFQKKIRGIEHLLQLVKQDNRFVLDIAGTGDELDSVVKEYAAECNRIIFHGKVLYDEALELMHNSDFIVALYYLSIPVHKYASPNKFHESLFLGRPIITSKDTLVGARVEAANTGYVVDDTLEGLASVFDGYGTESYLIKYREKCKNCGQLWENNYKNYRTQWMEGEYIKLIRRLAGK